MDEDATNNIFIQNHRKNIGSFLRCLKYSLFQELSNTDQTNGSYLVFSIFSEWETLQSVIGV